MASQQVHELTGSSYAGRQTDQSPGFFRSLISHVISFEMTFVLFLFGGIYKTDPRFSWFPGDITIVFLGLSVLIGGQIILFGLVRGGLYKPGVVAVFCAVAFILWAALTRVWTPGLVYAGDKFFNMTVVVVWCTVAGALIMSSNRVRVQRFFTIILIVGAIACADSTIKYLAAGGQFREEYYLSVGRMAGLAAVVAFVYWLREPFYSPKGMFWLACFGVTCYVLLTAGGRAPTAALAISLMVVPFLYVQPTSKTILLHRAMLPTIALLLIAVLALVYATLFSDADLRTLNRFNVLFSERQGHSASERFDFWTKAIEFWAAQPLIGQGIGSFPILYFNIDDRRYPHNIVLELLMEFGLIGFIIFATMVFFYLRRVSLRRLRQDPLLMCAALLCVNTLVNAMSTGDISDNRNFFISLGLLAMRPIGERLHAKSNRSASYVSP